MKSAKRVRFNQSSTGETSRSGAPRIWDNSAKSTQTLAIQDI